MENYTKYNQDYLDYLERANSIELTFKSSMNEPSDKFIHKIIFQHHETYYERNESDPSNSDVDAQLINTIRMIIEQIISKSNLSILNNLKDLNVFTAGDEYFEFYLNFLNCGPENLHCIILEKHQCPLFRDVVEIILFREMSKHAFKNKLFITAMYYHQLSFEAYGKIKYRENIEDDFNKQVSEKNRKKALDYWQPKNKKKELRKARYLAIFKERGFTKYIDAAEFIYNNSNDENRNFRQIYDELREADKKH